MTTLQSYSAALLAVICGLSGHAQQGYQFIGRDHNRAIEKHINSPESNIHGQIQPYLNAELVQEINPDSLRADSLSSWSDGMFLRSRTPLSKSSRWRIFPMVNLLSGVDANSEHTRGTYELGGGIGIGGDIGKNFSFYGDVWVQYGRYPLFLENYMLQREVNPGKGYARWDGTGIAAWDYTAYLSYSPLKPFNFQAGVGKNHWGDGIRSLVLSDQATSYPFLKISTTVWNIKYVNLFNAMYDIRGASGDYNRFALKFSSFHMLSWNISQRVNVSLWESVIWQNRDNENLRGFDINYLNPIIFYRPVEFSQGSSDRVTLGTNVSVKVGRNTKLFAQIAIDEFLLDSLLARNGWFGNKQALQVGVKSYDAFNIEGLDLRGEFNLIRPFFYQHVSVKQNHAHFNEPLAHTLGNNLYEGIVAGRYQHKRWVFDAQFIISQYGTNPDTLNLGGDLWRTDSDPQRPMSGHRTGQGITHWLAAADLRVGYILDSHWGLRVELGYVPRYMWIEEATNYTHFLQVGIRTALWNRNRNF